MFSNNFRWDADVIESRMLPQFQDLGDTGLLPLGDLMVNITYFHNPYNPHSMTKYRGRPGC